MNYLVLVSHGNFAAGLHHALTMFVKEREDIKSIGLKEGEDVAAFAERVNAMCETFQKDDGFLILADLIGGSPLTTLMNCFSQKGLLDKAVILGGMNLAMALNGALMKDDLESAKTMALHEAEESIKELSLSSESEEDI